MVRRMYFLAASLSLLAGCPDTSGPPPARAPTVCERAGQPCQLPAGPMGICNESLAAECETPPCLACFSQH
ncbi:MAG: hypothetical protein M3Y87_18700 [Myxococcota bacterium]|nr:hypothetical protein [Myxococcota bacterium]